MQRIQRKRFRNKHVEINSKLPGVYTLSCALQYILKAELCTWRKSHYGFKTLLKILSWNILTMIPEQRVWMTLVYHTVTSTFLTMKYHSIFFIFHKEGQKNWAEVKDLKNVNQKAISKKKKKKKIDCIN